MNERVKLRPASNRTYSDKSAMLMFAPHTNGPAPPSPPADAYADADDAPPTVSVSRSPAGDASRASICANRAGR